MRRGESRVERSGMRDFCTYNQSFGFGFFILQNRGASNDESDRNV